MKKETQKTQREKMRTANIVVYLVRLYTCSIIVLNILSNLIPLSEGKEHLIKVQYVPSIIIFVIFTGIHIKFKNKME